MKEILNKKKPQENSYTLPAVPHENYMSPPINCQGNGLGGGGWVKDILTNSYGRVRLNFFLRKGIVFLFMVFLLVIVFITFFLFSNFC